jgi:phage shock protein PspC (stress-responsive transcriptional regulator)
MNNNLFRYQGYIGGVCEGLGIWSGIPSVLWRISFVFLFQLGFGFILFFGLF